MRENLFVRTIKNRIIAVILISFVFAIAAICYDVMWVRPVYSVDSKIVVSAKTGNTSSTQIETAKSFIESRSLLEDVNTKLELKSSADELSKKIKLSESNSQIISLNVKDTVIQRARDIADQLADSSVEKNTSDEFEVKVLEYSSNPTSPVSPNLVRDTIAAYIIGFVLSLIISMIVESKDDIVRKDTRFENIGINIIGDIPYVDERSAIIDEG